MPKPQKYTLSFEIKPLSEEAYAAAPDAVRRAYISVLKNIPLPDQQLKATIKAHPEYFTLKEKKVKKSFGENFKRLSNLKGSMELHKKKQKQLAKRPGVVQFSGTVSPVSAVSAGADPTDRNENKKDETDPSNEDSEAVEVEEIGEEDLNKVPLSKYLGIVSREFLDTIDITSPEKPETDLAMRGRGTGMGSLTLGEGINRILALTPEESRQIEKDNPHLFPDKSTPLSVSPQTGIKKKPTL